MPVRVTGASRAGVCRRSSRRSGGRAAGTITAAMFLSKFVGDFPWVHLDIAGPAWTTKDRGYIPKGASGIPVRLLMEFLQNRVQEKK